MGMHLQAMTCREHWMNPKSRITALQMPKTTLERPLIALASRALKVHPARRSRPSTYPRPVNSSILRVNGRK